MDCFETTEKIALLITTVFAEMRKTVSSVCFYNQFHNLIYADNTFMTKIQSCFPSDTIFSIPLTLRLNYTEQTSPKYVTLVPSVNPSVHRYSI